MKKLLLLISFLLISTYSFGQTITPFVDYVTNLGNGTYVVTYGYTSTYASPVNLPVTNVTSLKNYFNPDPMDRGQPTVFLPGTHNFVFNWNASYGSTSTWSVINKNCTYGTKNITIKQTDHTTIMPAVGQTLTYNLKYNVNEGQALEGAKLIDTLPAGTQFVSATGGGVSSNGVVIWDMGTLGQGAAGNVDVTVLVTSYQVQYLNKAYIQGSMSLANYRGYDEDINNGPAPTRTTDSSYIVAFEDLKNSGWNDWDVNDFVVGMKEKVTFDGSNNVTKIVFDYEALARGSAFVNKFNHLVKLTGNSTATLVVKDSNGIVLPALGFTNQNFSGNIDVSIFPNTYNALPPQAGLAFTNVENVQSGVVKGYTATLTITTDGVSNTSANYLRNSSQPYLINELNRQIGISSLAGTLGNTQNVDNIGNQSATLYGYFLDLGYRLPYDWKWSLESVAIWNAFPQFDQFILSSQSTNTTWYNNPDLSKVWTRRVVTENIVFTGESGTRVYANSLQGNGVKQTSAGKNYSLSQNYPNPFNPATKISFSIPKNELVSVKIFDMAGKEIAQLVNGELNAGTYEYTFNGSSLSSGVYFYQIKTASYSEIKKMTLVK
ncbi:MAG: LruC domain-containing protein [Bacteroidetes bacterium]|nr:LruC domain-containing protein [Bacteroidota bacterium]